MLQLMIASMDAKYRLKKLQQSTQYPDVLDLTAFTAPGVLKGDHSMRYTLSSVVAHKGQMNAGHYIAIAKGPGGIYECDDDSITRTNRAQLLKPGNGFVPYILTYIASDSK